MSQDPKVPAHIQQLLGLVGDIANLKIAPIQSNYEKRLETLMIFNDVLAKNPNIKFQDINSQVVKSIHRNLQPDEIDAVLLYNLLFQFVIQTVHYAAKVAQTQGYKNLQKLFTNSKIIYLFQRSMVFNEYQKDQQALSEYIYSLQWIIYKTFSQIKNNIFYGGLNVIMVEISQKQQVFVLFDFNIVSDFFLFLSQMAGNLQKSKLITLLFKVFQQLRKMSENGQKFKQFCKNSTMDGHKNLKSYIQNLIKQMENDVSFFGEIRDQLNNLKQLIQYTLNQLGYQFLNNQSIEKRLIGLRMMYHDMINQQDYFKWIKQKQVFQLILKEKSQYAFVNSSGYIFKLVIRFLKTNRQYLGKILEYIINSNTQIRKSVLKHLESSTLFQNITMYDEIIQKLLSSQKPEFYSNQLVDFINRLLPRATYNHNSLIMQKFIKVYLQLLAHDGTKKYLVDRCKYIINECLVKIFQKKSLSNLDLQQKFNVLFGIYDNLVIQPLKYQKISLLNSITKKILQKYSINKDSKQKIIDYLIRDKNIIQKSMRWIAQTIDINMRQQIENFICKVVQHISQKTRQILIENKQFLVQATASFNIFKKLLVLFENNVDKLKNNLKEFINKCYQRCYPSNFRCICYYFSYINHGKISNPKERNFQISCIPSQLIGIDTLFDALMQSKKTLQRDQLAQFISDIYTNYSESAMDKCQKYLQTIFTQICNNFAEEWSISLIENKFERILGYLALIENLMICTQYCGVGKYKSFDQQVPIYFVFIRFINSLQKPNSQNRNFQTQVASNMMFFDLLTIVCSQFNLDISEVQIKYENENKVFQKRYYSLTLEQLDIDGKTLYASINNRNPLIKKSRRQKLSSGNKLTPLAEKAITQIFFTFAPEGVMKQLQCTKFVNGVTKSPLNSVNSTDQRIINFFKQYDDNNDGEVNLQNFIHFYTSKIDQRTDSVIWSNLRNMGYRYDLRKQREPIEPYPDRILLRSYLSKKQKIYQTLFQMLKFKNQQLRSRSIKILKRLPQYKNFTRIFQDNFQLLSRDTFQIEYYLTLIQKNLKQQSSIERGKQFNQSGRNTLIFTIMNNYLSKQIRNCEESKCLFLSIKILRSLSPIQSLLLPPNFINYTAGEYLTQLKYLDNDIFIKIISQTLYQQKIQQIQFMFALKLQQNLIKNQRYIDKMGLDVAQMGIFSNKYQIRQITCNFIYYMSINEYINKDFHFKETINSFFDIKLQKNTNTWFETLFNIISANFNFIDLKKITESCLAQLQVRKQTLQDLNDEVIYGCLSQIYNILKNKNKEIQLSFQKIVNISENIISSQNRRVIYHILALIDYEKAIFYAKQLIQNTKVEMEDQVSPRNSYIGLCNLGNTCYINSVIQLFFWINKFRHQVLKINIIENVMEQQKFDPSVDKGKQLLDQIKNLYIYLQSGSNKFYDMSNFCKVYKDRQCNPIDVKKQQDAHEFFHHFLEVMEVYYIKSSKKDIFQKIFNGKIVGMICCTLCQQNKIVQQKFSCLNLQVKGNSTLKASLDKFTKPQMMQDYRCENCNNKGKVKKQTKFRQLPEYLTISLKKIYHDLSMNKFIKISSKFQFPFQINLKNYIYSNSTINQNQYQYQLKSFIVHSGTSQSGHYYSIIKIKDKWFKFDDKNVTEYNIRDIQEQGYGGAEQYQNYGFQQYPHSRNAYILCFKKITINQQDKQVQYTPSRQQSEQMRQQKISIINQMKICNDSVFMFCTELFQQLRPEDVRIQDTGRFYNDQWQTDQNCQKYNQIFDLSYSLLMFLGRFSKLENHFLITKLCNQMCSLFYLVPQKSHFFVSNLNSDFILKMLCFDSDHDLKYYYKHVLARSIYIFYDYYQFNFDTDDETAKHLKKIIIEVLELFYDKRFFENVFFLESYIQFWKIMIQCIKTIENYVVSSTNLLIRLTQIISVDCSAIQNQIPKNFVPVLIAKLICDLIGVIFKGKIQFINKKAEELGIKITIDENLTAKESQLLRNPQLYSNVLKNNLDINKSLSITISKLAQNNEQFSKQISLVFLKGFKTYEDKIDILSTMLNYLLGFLRINDSLKLKRCKWILGIWQLEMGDQLTFGFKKDINSPLFNYVSTLYFSQSAKYSPLLQQLVLINQKNPKQNTVQLLNFMMEVLIGNDIALIYLKKAPSPICTFKNYFDWMQTFLQKMITMQERYFPLKKSAIIQKFSDYYYDLKQRINHERGADQIEKPFPPFIIGRNYKINQIKFVQDFNYKLVLYSHETFIMQKLQNRKQNELIPLDLFEKPQSRYFLSIKKDDQGYDDRQLFQIRKTMMTLEICSHNDLKIQFRFKYFKQQIYVIAGRALINFPYEDLTKNADWENFIKIQVIENIQTSWNRKFSEDTRLKPINIIQDHRQKACPICTCFNQILAQKCKVCENAFY